MRSGALRKKEFAKLVHALSSEHGVTLRRTEFVKSDDRKRLFFRGIALREQAGQYFCQCLDALTDTPTADAIARQLVSRLLAEIERIERDGPQCK